MSRPSTWPASTGSAPPIWEIAPAWKPPPLALGDVVVLDIRPDAEYSAGHIPGARSVPPGELRRSLAVLPEGTEVVADCRGPYCAYADDAVRELDRHGYRARISGARTQ